MHVCPRASLVDGLLEVTVIDALSMVELLRDIRVLYSDDLYVHPKTHHHRARLVHARSPEPVWIEVDGEPLGRLPVEIEIVPQALPLLVPAGGVV
jgi:diacylglycerol kinase (ATP)